MNRHYINAGDKKNRVVEVIPLNFGSSYGLERYTLVGFEPDGTVWTQAKDLGVVPEQAGPLLDHPQSWLIVDLKHQLVFLNLQIAVKLIEPAEKREKWLTFAGLLFQEYQRFLAYDSTRNH